MNRPQCRWILPVLGLLSFHLIGCDTGLHHRRNFVCLIDYSGSMKEEDLHRYVKVISNNILGHLEENDRLVVLPIDGASKTEAAKVFYIDMSQRVFSLPTDGYVHASDSTRKRIHEYVKTISDDFEQEIHRQKRIRRQFSNYSDIFSALQQAGVFVERPIGESSSFPFSGLFSSRKRFASENIIILFSDMRHESAEVTFATHVGCPPEDVPRILKALKRRSAIPNLSGSKVFVYGRTGRSNTQVDNIENFWTEYFREANGELLAYDYEPDNIIVSYLAASQ